MKNDEYGRIGYSQEEIIEGLRKNSKLKYDDALLLDGEKYNKAIKKTYIPMTEINNWEERNIKQSIEEYHLKNKNNWKMPIEYKSLDIETELLNNGQLIRKIYRRRPNSIRR